MPNGYTQDIYDGSNLSLRDYLMGVGRSMSMSIMQRDEDPSAPVRLREVTPYYKDSLNEAAAEVKRLMAMTKDEVRVAAEDEYATTLAQHVNAVRKENEMRGRYDDMIAKVEAWEPEAVIAYVKDHALKYLTESKDFDCGFIYPKKPVPQDYEPTAWFASKLDAARQKLKRYGEEYQKEVERVAGFNLHIEAFHRSLPDA